MAYYTSMSQEGISFKVQPGPAAMAGVAFPGEEAVRNFHSKLCSDFEPYSSPCQGRAGTGGDSAYHAVNSRKDRTGI